MNRLSKTIKLTVLGLALLLVLGLIWLMPYLLGWDIDYSVSNRLIQLLLTLLVLTVVGCTLVIKRAKSSKQDVAAEDKKIVGETQQQAVFHQEVWQFFYNLRHYFNNFGSQKRKFLRQLPWYLLVGKKSSGKTMFLSKSGLNFLPTEKLLKNPSDSYDDDMWRFSQEAVILEMPFDAAEADKPSDIIAGTSFGSLNSAFWTALLKFVRRYRSSSRFNGVIMTLDLSTLLVEQGSEISHQQQALKSALYDLHQQLKTPSPVFLLLTKCDLIAGFREFFADLSQQEREQVWGVAFPKKPFVNRQQALEYFNKEFDRLIDKINQRLLIRLEAERNVENRVALSYFPQQLQQFKQAIAEFILQDETVQLRGVYFGSSLQEGGSIDWLMSKLSHNLQLENPGFLSTFSQKKSYFLDKFFPEIVLPEVNWVMQTPYWERRTTIRNRMAWGMGMSLLLMALIGFSFSYHSNTNNLEAITEYLPAYQQAVQEFSPTDEHLGNVLPVLSALKNIQNVYAAADHPWLAWLEFYEPIRIQSMLDTAWSQALSTVLMPKVAARLETLLQGQELGVEALYQVLKGYLVFTPNSKADRQWLKAPVAADLAETLKDQPDEQNQLNSYLAEAIQQPIFGIKANNQAIATAREQLRKVPPVQFAYYEMKQTAEDSHDQVDLDEKLGSEFSEIFHYRNHAVESIPALYTNEGYKSLQGKHSELLIAHTAEIYQILGLSDAENSGELSAQMTPELWSLYNADYIEHWQGLLNNIEVVPFTSLPQAIQALDTLTSVNSPLLKLSHLVKDNTAPVRSKYMQVSLQFAPFNTAMSISASAVQYAKTLKALQDLRKYLVMLNNSTNVAQLEFQDAKAIMQQKLPNNPIVVLRHEAEQLPVPLNGWFTEIADNSMELLFRGAHQVINSAWQSTVLPYYQTNIHGRFPFANDPEAYVNMNNFGAFFGGDGIFAQFYQNYLAAFIEANHDTWREYTFGKYSLGLSDIAMDRLHRAWLIRNMYFQNGDSVPAMQFYLQPRYLDSDASSMNVQLGAHIMNYRHGPPQSVSWHWPFAGDTQHVSVTFTDFQDRNFSRSFDGPWAWFQLLGSTTLEATGASGRYIWTITEGGHTASFDIWTTNNLPAFDLQILKDFSLPATL